MLSTIASSTQIGLKVRMLTTGWYVMFAGEGVTLADNIINTAAGFLAESPASRSLEVSQEMRNAYQYNRWFDVSGFVLPAPVPDPVRGGQYIPFGNSGVVILTGDGMNSFDLSLRKAFDVGPEGHRSEFRAEFFNAFNHAQFLGPSATLLTGLEGRALAARPARQIQLGLNYSF